MAEASSEAVWFGTVSQVTCKEKQEGTAIKHSSQSGMASHRPVIISQTEEFVGVCRAHNMRRQAACS